MTRAFPIMGALALWALSIAGAWIEAYDLGQNNRSRHTEVVILDATKPPFGPWMGKCLELYPDHPVCAVDDRIALSGLFYPRVTR